jgi:sorting nexin-1/2
VAKQRTELATATGEFATAAGDLSQSDVGKQLAASLSGLADVERKAQDIQTKQTEADMITLMATGKPFLFLLCDNFAYCWL